MANIFTKLFAGIAAMATMADTARGKGMTPFTFDFQPRVGARRHGSRKTRGAFGNHRRNTCPNYGRA